MITLRLSSPRGDAEGQVELGDEHDRPAGRVADWSPRSPGATRSAAEGSCEERRDPLDALPADVGHVGRADTVRSHSPIERSSALTRSIASSTTSAGGGAAGRQLSESWMARWATVPRAMANVHANASGPSPRGFAPEHPGEPCLVTHSTAAGVDGEEASAQLGEPLVEVGAQLADERRVELDRVARRRPSRSSVSRCGRGERRVGGTRPRLATVPTAVSHGPATLGSSGEWFMMGADDRAAVPSPTEPTTTLDFAAAARAISAASRRTGLVVPGFRTPPRLVGVDRTVRRHGDGATVVGPGAGPVLAGHRRRHDRRRRGRQRPRCPRGPTGCEPTCGGPCNGRRRRATSTAARRGVIGAVTLISSPSHRGRTRRTGALRCRRRPSRPPGPVRLVRTRRGRRSPRSTQRGRRDDHDEQRRAVGGERRDRGDALDDVGVGRGHLETERR